MSKKTSKFNAKGHLLPIKLMAIGMVAGFVSGFFGAGGGIVLIISASVIIKNEDLKDIFARTAVMTALFSVVSAITYIKQGSLPFLSTALLIIPAILGGIFGAHMLDKIPAGILRVIFGAISAIGGIIMLIF